MGVLRHGHKQRGATTPEYKIWLGIKRRCSDLRHKDYVKYGGKGIRVCLEWDESFVQFLADMGPRGDGMTIDRIDPLGHYEAANCRWASKTQQGQENKTSLIGVTIDGQFFPSLSAACRFFGLNKTTVSYRRKSGMSLEQIFSRRRVLPRRARESYLPKSHPDRH